MRAWVETLMPLALLVSPGFPGPHVGAAGPAIAWEEWSPGVFARAGAEHRLVLLDLGAAWCHWCHVMEETTYADREVVRLVREHFLPVRVDQDARPDLSNRYEDYGWPATVVFDEKGTEIVKLSGYIPPPRMISLLEAIIEDPSPGPSARSVPEPAWAGEASLSPELRATLEQSLVERYDTTNEGWGFAKKFLDWDAVEYSLARAGRGDAEAARRARGTLLAERKLIDPVWGGAYQYSDSGDWNHPHFEKIMAFQAETLRIYALAHALTGEPAYREAAEDVHRYLRSFLTSPEGAFYVSQDADLVAGEHGAAYFSLGDAERRARGVPRVDRHLYTRETAWAATALVALYAATSEPEPLQEAERAARWILAKRGLPSGGFRHDEQDAAGPYLGDTIAAARAFLALYSATSKRSWLVAAQDAVAWIDRTFRVDGRPGYATAVVPRGETARPQRDENVAVARTANLLFHHTGLTEQRRVAEQAMRFLATPEIASRFETGGVLLTDLELRAEPLHVTVVGRRDDAAAQALLRAALGSGPAYKRLELWDRREGPLPRADVSYPELASAAAFVCTEGRCSAPAFTPQALRARLEAQ